MTPILEKMKNPQFFLQKENIKEIKEDIEEIEELEGKLVELDYTKLSEEQKKNVEKYKQMFKGIKENLEYNISGGKKSSKKNKSSKKQKQKHSIKLSKKHGGKKQKHSKKSQGGKKKSRKTCSKK